MRVFIDFCMDLGCILGGFWGHFEVKNRCIFLNDFWTCYFCDSGARLGGDPTSARLQQGRLRPRCSPGGALIARIGRYNDPRDA